MFIIENIRANSAGKYKGVLDPGLVAKLRFKRFAVVGAGPGLDNSKDELIYLQKQGYIVICMARAYPCIQDDLKPDYICQLDPGDMFNGYFVDTETEGIGLLCKMLIDPGIFQEWRGPVYTFLPPSEVCGGEYKAELEALAKDRNVPFLPLNLTAAWLRLFLFMMEAADVRWFGCGFWFNLDKYYARPFPKQVTDENTPGVYLDPRFGLGSERFTDNDLALNLQAFEFVIPFFHKNRERLLAMVPKDTAL